MGDLRRVGQPGSSSGCLVTAEAARRIEEELDLGPGSVGKPVTSKGLPWTEADARERVEEVGEERGDA